jgi:hypothetical protein
MAFTNDLFFGFMGSTGLEGRTRGEASNAPNSDTPRFHHKELRKLKLKMAERALRIVSPLARFDRWRTVVEKKQQTPGRSGPAAAFRTMHYRVIQPPAIRSIDP